MSNDLKVVDLMYKDAYKEKNVGCFCFKCEKALLFYMKSKDEKVIIFDTFEDFLESDVTVIWINEEIHETTLKKLSSYYTDDITLSFLIDLKEGYSIEINYDILFRVKKLFESEETL